MRVDGHTGLELLQEAAEVLELVAGACEREEDAGDLLDLAGRLRSYLASSRPTTPLGMPQIKSEPVRLTEEMVVHSASRTHIRIVPR